MWACGAKRRHHEAERVGMDLERAAALLGTALDETKQPDQTIEDEVVFGRDQDHLRVFISSKMDGSLDSERQATHQVVSALEGHRAWWWEDDAPAGVLHSEQICTKYAKTSDGLVLLVGGALSQIIYAEYQAAKDGGAQRYVFVREDSSLPSDVREFIRTERAGEVVTRDFKNIAELRTHLHRSLVSSLIRASRLEILYRQTRQSTRRGGRTA